MDICARHANEAEIKMANDDKYGQRGWSITIEPAENISAIYWNK